MEPQGRTPAQRSGSRGPPSRRTRRRGDAVPGRLRGGSREEKHEYPWVLTDQPCDPFMSPLLVSTSSILPLLLHDVETLVTRTKDGPLRLGLQAQAWPLGWEEGRLPGRPCRPVSLWLARQARSETGDRAVGACPSLSWEGGSCWVNFRPVAVTWVSMQRLTHLGQLVASVAPTVIIFHGRHLPSQC